MARRPRVCRGDHEGLCSRKRMPRSRMLTPAAGRPEQAPALRASLEPWSYAWFSRTPAWRATTCSCSSQPTLSDHYEEIPSRSSDRQVLGREATVTAGVLLAASCQTHDDPH